MSKAPLKDVLGAEVVKQTFGEALKETGEEAVEDICEEPLKETCEESLEEIYGEAFYEESVLHGSVDGDDYVTEEQEIQARLDEEALRERLDEEDWAEREMEERMRQDREHEELLWKIDYGIAEPEDFGIYRSETNWDVLLSRMKDQI